MDNQPSNRAGGSGNFLVQGSILAVAGIIVRFIGLLYKIPITRALGDDGIGYFNTAHEIYNVGLILSSYSLPLAMSKLIAARRVKKRYRDVKLNTDLEEDDSLEVSEEAEEEPAETFTEEQEEETFDEGEDMDAEDGMDDADMDDPEEDEEEELLELTEEE